MGYKPELRDFELYMDDPDDVGYVVLFSNPDGETVEHTYPLTELGLWEAWDMVRFAHKYPGVTNLTITRYHRDNEIWY